ESLDKNWRSAKEIIDFNNKVFSPLGYPPLSLKISEDERKELETQAENRCEAALASILTKDDSIPFLCSDLAELPDAREGENLTRYMARRMARAYQGTAQEYGDKAPDGGRAVLLTFPKKAEPETEADANEEGEGETVFESDPQIRAIGRIILSRVSAKIEAIRQKKSNAQKDEKHIQDTIVTRDEIPWSDFMVLVRTNNQATKVARHMAALGIPVITENSLMLVEHPLVIQTVALLSFLRAPDDDAAFWTLISGSLLGLEVPSSAGEAESAAGTSSSETSTVAPAPETAPSAEQTVPAASACSEDEADRLPAGAYSEDEDEEEGFPCSECTLESVPYTPAQQVSVCRTESNASTDAPERPNQEESATDSGAGEPTDGEAAQEAGGGDASELSAMEREARRVNAWDLELALLSRTRRWNKDGTRESLSACWSRKYKDLWDTSVAPLLSGGASMAPYDLVSEWYDHVDAYRRFRDGEPFLRRMLEILHTSALHGLRSLDDFLDYWNEHGEDEKLPMPEGLKAVSIMTMHKSKGLQRDTVIVPWTTTTERGSAKLQVVDYVPKNGGEPVHALCKPDYFFPRQRINKLADALEAMNRYYVAFTRAKSELYVFLSEKPEGSGKMLQQLIDNAGTSIPKKIPWADSDFASVPEVLPPEAQLDAVPQAEEAGSTAEASSPERSASAAAPDAQLNANSPAEEAGKSDPEASSPEQDGSAAAPEAQLDADSPAEGQSGPQQLWEPTLWMPSMRLHFDFMDESNPRDAAREQGIFIHGCLEALARVPAEARSSESDFSACLERVLTDHGRRAPWLMEMEGFRDEARDEISWFAALERRFGWLDNALPEQGLIDGQGYNKRMDLMVMGPKQILVLDYKTGRAEEAYQAEHHAQVRGYLQCVRDAGRRDRPAPLGIVVYLKDRRLHIVLPDGSSWKNGQRVSGKDAVSLLLDETEFAQALNELENREDAG
ncbi:MAG: 3'-5' exonuclease, partial [Desulfovibrionaceae bacterium]|nr:3'-5' exonuclease [Desulfovibrionaceae bacterium]